jgi:hypothetical protein
LVRVRRDSVATADPASIPFGTIFAFFNREAV